MFEHGSLPTMVYIYKQFNDVDRQAMKRPLHKHDSICEFLLIFRGKGTYLQAGRRYELSEGSLICCNQGVLHEMGPEEMDCYCIGITNLKKKGLPVNHLIPEGQCCVQRSGEHFLSLKNICDQIFELEGSGVGGSLAAQLLCSGLISMLDELEENHEEEEADTEEAMITRIQNYLNQNFTENVSLESIAESLNCSKTYVSHLYKRLTGKTPIQYVTQRRIGLAQTLLISTEMSAADISVRVGYDNPNYFNTVFSKIVGMTPIRYRINYKENVKGVNNQI